MATLSKAGELATPSGSVEEGGKVGKGKGAMVNRNNLDSFFSPSQVNKSQSDEVTLERDDENSSNNVRRNSLKQYFTLSQKTPNKDTVSDQNYQVTHSNNIINNDLKLTSNTKKQSPGQKSLQNSKSGGRGFFAAKLQGNLGKAHFRDGLLETDKSSEESDCEVSTCEDEVKGISKEQDSTSEVDVDAPGTSATSYHGNQNPSNADEIMCDKCNKPISVWEYLEHQDFHFALELQKQSQGEVACVDVSKKSRTLASERTSETGKKRGRPPGSSSSNSARVESNATIHNFFKPK